MTEGIAEHKKEKRQTNSLECKIDDAQLREYSKRLAEGLAQRTRVENSLESAKSQAKFEIQALDADIALMTEKVNSEKEYRNVDVIVTIDFEKGIKQYCRTDTGDIYREEPLTETERQQELPI